MNAWRHLELVNSSEVVYAWYPKHVNLNGFLHFHRDWGVAVVIGFTNRQKANRWLRKHYPEERRNIVLKEIRTEVASMLWNPHLMIIKDIDLEWGLERIKEYDASDYELFDWGWLDSLTL